MYAEIFAVLAPIFVIVGIGFHWGRSGRPFDNALVSGLVMNIGAPCLILSTLGRVQLSFAQFSQLALAALLVMALTLLIGAIWLRGLRLPVRDFLPSMTFPNTGNMGLPVALFAFGDAGLAAALTLFIVISVVHFSLGLMLLAPSWRIRSLLKVPILYAAALATLQVAFEWQMPTWVGNTLQLLGGFSIPLMLIALGVSLSTLRVADLACSLKVGSGRLVVGMLVGVVVAKSLALDPLGQAAVILQSAMPVAVFNYLLAVNYRRSEAAVAGAVVISTAASFALLPLLLWYLLPLG